MYKTNSVMVKVYTVSFVIIILNFLPKRTLKALFQLLEKYSCKTVAFISVILRFFRAWIAIKNGNK